MVEPRPFASVRAFQEYIEDEFKKFEEWFQGTNEEPGVIGNATLFFESLTELENWVSALTLGWIRDKKHSSDAQTEFYRNMLMLREIKFLLNRPGRSTTSRLRKFLGASDETGIMTSEKWLQRRWEAIKTLYIIDLFTFIRLGVDNRIYWQSMQIEDRLKRQAENPFSQMAAVYRLKSGVKSEHPFAPPATE